MRVHWMRLAVIVIALSLVAGCTSAGPAPTSVPTLQPVPAVVPTLQPAPIAVPTLQPTPTTSAAAIPLEFVSKITGGPNPFDGPFGLALDQQGNLYVVDTGNSRILKFDSTGKFLLEWGSQGSADGQFNFPHGPYGGSVAVDAQGNVYVADSVNDRIQKFDSNGQFLTKWGKSGTGDGEFADPFGVAVDRLSNVYVIDDDNPRIQKFDSNGRFLSKWGSQGSGEGQFSDPGFLTFDREDNIHVADYYNNRIQVFDNAEKFLAKWDAICGSGQFMRPEAVAVDGQGNVYVTDGPPSARICKFDSKGRFLGMWGSKGVGDGQFMETIDIVIDQQGNVYISDYGNNRINKFRQR